MRHLTPQIGRRTAAALAVPLLVFGAAACAEDTSTDSNAAEGAVSSAPEGTFQGTKAEGSPIKIGVINSEDGPAISQPEGRLAADAAVKYANENLGGIGGHPIETFVCKSKEDTASATDCANQMVEQKVAAVAVLNTAHGDAMAPIITGAGIPYTGYNGAGGTELRSDKSFFWTGGFPSVLIGMAQYAAEHGHKTATLFVTDNAAVVGSTEAMGKPAFEKAGVTLTVAPIPLGTPDASSQVAAGVKDKPGMVGLVGDATMCTSTLKGLTTVQYSGDMLVVSPCIEDSTIEGAGEALGKSKVVTSTSGGGSDKESLIYRAVMAKYAPDTSLGGASQTGFQSMLGLIRAAASLTGEPTAANTMTAIRAAADVPIPLGGGATMTCNGTALAGLKAPCANYVLVGDLDDKGKSSDVSLIQLNK